MRYISQKERKKKRKKRERERERESEKVDSERSIGAAFVAHGSESAAPSSQM